MHAPRLSLKALWRLYHEAQELLRSGQTRDAAASFTRLAVARVRRSPRTSAPTEVTNPLIARARLGLCSCFVEQGRLEEALRELRAALEVEPDNTDALCELAYIY